MTDATPAIPSPTPPSSLSLVSSNSALAVEIAKCLKLVAPASMGSEAQLTWLATAVDALEGIRAEEVANVSAEIRRSVTRPAQIVPEIARLVAERRKRRHDPVERAGPSLWSIHQEGAARMKKAGTQAEIEDAQAWERQALIDGNFAVRPIAPPLTRAELDKLPREIAAMGLKGGFLERREGKLYEREARG